MFLLKYNSWPLPWPWLSLAEPGFPTSVHINAEVFELACAHLAWQLPQATNRVAPAGCIQQQVNPSLTGGWTTEQRPAEVPDEYVPLCLLARSPRRTDRLTALHMYLPVCVRVCVWAGRRVVYAGGCVCLYVCVLVGVHSGSKQWWEVKWGERDKMTSRRGMSWGTAASVNAFWIRVCSDRAVVVAHVLLMSVPSMGYWIADGAVC